MGVDWERVALDMRDEVYVMARLFFGIDERGERKAKERQSKAWRASLKRHTSKPARAAARPGEA